MKTKLQLRHARVDQLIRGELKDYNGLTLNRLVRLNACLSITESDTLASLKRIRAVQHGKRWLAK